jgi:hypothetical protein
MLIRNDIPMFSKQSEGSKTEVQRVKLTALITWGAYDAITELQRRHRRKTGKHLRRWRVVDAAIRGYAKKKRITVDE